MAVNEKRLAERSKNGILAGVIILSVAIGILVWQFGGHPDEWYQIFYGIKHICGIHYSKGVFTIKPEYWPIEKCEGVFALPNGEKMIFGYDFLPDESLRVFRMERKGSTSPSSPGR